MANTSNEQTPAGANEALTPLRESGRVFRWHDHMALWFSLGVGLLVMQIGAYLVPAVGTRDAAIVIYHACAAWAPQWGSALPTLAITFVLAWITRPSPAGGTSALAQSRG